MANKWDERKRAQEDEYFVKKERDVLAKLKAKQETVAAENLLHALSQVRCASETEKLPKD